MGGSSVPSSTTQTTMLDPTRQAALKKSMGYFDKWANSYNGPTYKGPLVAGRTADWYKAQDMAHKLSNRFAEGGITSVRRFEGGGDTTAQPWWSGYNDAQDAQDAGVTQPVDNTYTPLSQQQLENQAVNAGYQGDYTDTAAMNSFINANNQSVAPAVTQQPAVVNNTIAGGTTNDTVTGGDYTAKTSSGNAGNPNLFAQMVTNANLGGLYGLTGVNTNQITNSYTGNTITPGTVTGGYTAGTITAPDKVTGGYTAGTIAAPSQVSGGYSAGAISPGAKITSDYTAGNINAPDKVTSGYTAGTVTPGTVTYNYTPAELAKIKEQTSSYTAGTHDIKDVKADKWNQAAMDQYMSPYTKGVVDIALREAERQRGIERLRENTAATQSGAFGGYRQGVVEAEGERNYNQLLSDITTKGQQEAYNAAVTQFNADRAVDVAVQQFNENNSMENFKALQQAQQTAAQLKLTAEQNNASNTINAYQAVEQAKQAAAAGNLTASQVNAANALQAAIANEQARQQAGQMGISAATANAANALQASIAQEQAKQAAGQMGLTAQTATASNILNASIASEQAKQAAGQQNITASSANAANALNAAIAQEQAKQAAGQQNITASSANAANALNAAIAAEQAKQAAGQQVISVSQANANNKLQADIATDQAKRAAEQMSDAAAQNNVRNGLDAITTSINAFQAGLSGAQGLATIETQYNNNMASAVNLLNSTDASARAAGQAYIEALMAKSKELDNLDLTKSQLASENTGIKSVNTGTVQVNKTQ